MAEVLDLAVPLGFFNPLWPDQVRDDPSAISGSMPTTLLICTTLALCVVLPISASAKRRASGTAAL
jgi:hypothetical protein